MIIEKKTTGVLVVPVLKGNIIVSNIQLLGGMNEVDDKVWGQVRASVMPHPHLKEHHVNDMKSEEKEEEYTVKNKEGEEEVKKRKKTFFTVFSKKFNKLPEKDALEIVEKTFDLKTLNKWKGSTGKESVRLSVMKQIEKVENRKAKMKSKKEED